MNKYPSPPPQRDPALFLRIAGQGAALASHSDLSKWLQGEVQHWLPHEAMVIGWGDFRSGQLQYDVVSGVPALRTPEFTPAAMGPLLGYLRDCWVAAQHVPCQVDLVDCEALLRDCTSAQRQALCGMRTAVVHGTMNRRRGTQRVFAALTTDATPPAGSGAALKLLLPFMDTAFGRMAPAPAGAAMHEEDRAHAAAAALPVLSERERQIMQWVALGKTNPEIGCILSISEFTVKNHMKSIFAKLDVTNRAQAVAKLTSLTAHA